MSELSIKVNIANRTYPLSVLREEEEEVRLEEFDRRNYVISNSKYYTYTIFIIINNHFPFTLLFSIIGGLIKIIPVVRR